MRPYLIKAVQFLLNNHVKVKLEKMPRCILPQYPELLSYEQGLVDFRESCKPEKCKQCVQNEACVGIITAKYERYGDAELIPITL
jgi:hypothetical protein